MAIARRSAWRRVLSFAGRAAPIRRDARVDDWGGFENHYTRKSIGGSNPPPAASLYTTSFPPHPLRGRWDIIQVNHLSQAIF